MAFGTLVVGSRLLVLQVHKYNAKYVLTDEIQHFEYGDSKPQKTSVEQLSTMKMVLSIIFPTASEIGFGLNVNWSITSSTVGFKCKLVHHIFHSGCLIALSTHYWCALLAVFQERTGTRVIPSAIHKPVE